MTTIDIVLNEKKWAKEAIDSLSLGKRPYETIVRVAKYYKAEGYSKRDLRRHVEDFIIRCDPGISLIKYDRSITSAILASEKYPMICIDGITVTNNEIDIINTMHGVLLQRLLFTLICLARYSNAVNPRNNNWVNRSQNEIFSMANINITNKRQSLMINDLWQSGMVEYSRMVDNTNLRILAVRDGEPAVTITDFRNVGNQYMQYIKNGEGYFQCEICGLILKQRSGKQKYCNACAEKVDRAMARDRHMIRDINETIFKKFDFGGTDLSV